MNTRPNWTLVRIRKADQRKLARAAKRLGLTCPMMLARMVDDLETEGTMLRLATAGLSDRDRAIDAGDLTGATHVESRTSAAR